MRDFCAAFVVASLAFGGQSVLADDAPTTGELAGSLQGYVDPEIANRTRCQDRPGRPRWMMVQPLGFEWRLELAKEYRSVQRTRLISEAETCDCDMLYPDWDALRSNLEKTWSEVSDQSKYVWDAATRERYHETRDALTDYARPLLPLVTRLCASVE